MKLLMLVFWLLVILLYPSFAGGTTSRNITCFLNNTPDGCLIGVYVNKEADMNSHASLCNVNNILYVNCYIVSSGGVLSSQYMIPIVFEYGNNCEQENKILLYLYRDGNSHVSLVQGANLIPICLSKEFSDVLDNTSGYPLISLYKESNSHVKSLNRADGDSVQLNFLDNIQPNITIEPGVDAIALPVTVNITYQDNKYLYLCKYYISEIGEVVEEKCTYKNNYIANVHLTDDICGGDTCTIVAEAVDLAGNIYTVSKTYKILKPVLNLYFEPAIGEYLRLFLLSYNFKMYVSNEGNTNITDINLTFKGCEKNLLILHNNFPIGELDIGLLKSNEEKVYEITIVPMAIGTCSLEIILEGKEELTGTEVNFTKKILIQIGTRGPLDVILVGEYLPIIPMILVAIITMLLI